MTLGWKALKLLPSGKVISPLYYFYTQHQPASLWAGAGEQRAACFSCAHGQLPDNFPCEVGGFCGYNIGFMPFLEYIWLKSYWGENDKYAPAGWGMALIRPHGKVVLHEHGCRAERAEIEAWVEGSPGLERMQVSVPRPALTALKAIERYQAEKPPAWEAENWLCYTLSKQMSGWTLQVHTWHSGGRTTILPASGMLMMTAVMTLRVVARPERSDEIGENMLELLRALGMVAEV